MLEVGKVIVIAVDDHRIVLNLALVESIWRNATNGFCEAKCDETHSSHLYEDDAYETYFLAPCTLRIWSADTACPEHEVRNPTGNDVTVNKPGILGPWPDAVKTFARLAVRYC